MSIGAAQVAWPWLSITQRERAAWRVVVFVVVRTEHAPSVEVVVVVGVVVVMLSGEVSVAVEGET